MDVIWQWTKGKAKVFTRDTELAEQALKDGFFVIGKKMNTHIIKY